MKHEKHRRILLFGIVLASLLIAAILLLEYIFGISGILALAFFGLGCSLPFWSQRSHPTSMPFAPDAVCGTPPSGRITSMGLGFCFTWPRSCFL